MRQNKAKNTAGRASQRASPAEALIEISLEVTVLLLGHDK